jgi:predicted transcriptional regulator
MTNAGDAMPTDTSDMAAQIVSAYVMNNSVLAAGMGSGSLPGAR